MTEANVDSAQEQVSDAETVSPENQELSDLERLSKEVTQAVRSEHSTLDKKIKALTKSERSAIERAEAYEQELADLDAEIDRAELEAAGDDPGELARIRKRQEADRSSGLLEDELDAERQSRAGDTEMLEAAEKIIRADAILKAASGQKVNAKELADTAEKLGLTTPEQIETLAKSLPKLDPTARVDSGVTTGGGVKPTTEQLDRMSPEQYAEYWKKRQK